jgi:hypothetical protein
MRYGIDAIHILDLYTAGFKPGDTAYVTVWVCLNLAGATYWDPILNRLIDPTAHPAQSGVVSFYVP